MSERDDTGEEREAVDPLADSGLEDLRDRLGELKDQVELLGSQGIWSEPLPPPQPEPPASGWSGQPPGEQPPAADYGPPIPEPPAPYGPPPAYEPPPGYEHPPPAYGPPAGYEYGPPQPTEPATGYGPQPPSIDPAWQQPGPEPPDDGFPPPPVATNGHSEDPAEVSARSTSVALVDAGPFEDLIELRHFEDDLASLTAVRDVRVRRFGHGRASIEVGMAGPYALSRELYRLDRQMSVTDGAAGDLIIDLELEPREPIAEDAPEAEGGPAEPLESEGT